MTLQDPSRQNLVRQYKRKGFCRRGNDCRFPRPLEYSSGNYQSSSRRLFLGERNHYRGRNNYNNYNHHNIHNNSNRWDHNNYSYRMTPHNYSRGQSQNQEGQWQNHGVNRNFQWSKEDNRYPDIRGSRW